MPKKATQLRSERNIRWIERHCKIPEGKFVGRAVKLTDEQRQWMRDIYDSPTRLFLLSMGRKNGKTAFAAFLLLLHSCGPEARQNTQLFSAAQARDQAALIFELAAKIVRMSPDLQSYMTVRDTAKQLVCPELGSVYKALSAEASTAFGLSPAFTVHDELGQVKGPRSDLYEALETASAAQQEPLSIVISTQAPTEGDLLSILIDDAISGADPRVKVRIYSAPMDMDPFSEAAIRCANPHFDSFMNKQEVLRQAADAKRMPSQEASFRNLILNQRVEARSPFVTKTVWDENGEKPLDDFEGREVYGGLDLSSVSDLTALVLASARDAKWDVRPTFWLPRDGLEAKARSDRVPYDIWAREGYLNTTPGAAIEYDFVAEYLRGIFDRCRVVAIAFDRWGMVHLKPCLVRAGFSEKELEKFISFGQGLQSMSPALRQFEALLLGRRLRHGKHPVLAMCAANATVVSDAAESRKFVKSKKTGRIDGMVATAMCVGVMPTQMPAAAPRPRLWVP